MSFPTKTSQIIDCIYFAKRNGVIPKTIILSDAFSKETLKELKECGILSKKKTSEKIFSGATFYGLKISVDHEQDSDIIIR